MRSVKADDMYMWDIETRPATLEQVELINPFDADQWIADEARRIRRHKIYKDDTKEKKIAELPDLVDDKRQEHYARAIDDSALNPFLCQILCITISDGPEKAVTVTQDDEESLLMWFWRDFVQSVINERHNEDVTEQVDFCLVGWNTHQFDLPLIVKRTQILDLTREIENLGVGDEVGRGWRYLQTQRGYWTDMFVDIREQWSLNDRFAIGSLHQLAKAMGHEGKSEPSGAKFWHHWQNDRERATEYIRTEFRSLWEVGMQLGVII